MSITDRSSSRGGTRVTWLALHTSEGGGTARALRDADWWTGSSHAICDNTELLTPAEGCVPYDRGSWTLRNGNARSENIEQIGYASWSRDYWLTNRLPQLRHTAKWLRDRSAARGIPLDYIGIDGVRAGRSGVIQHNDYSKGTGDGSHWDCGPGYPVDVVLDMARDGSAPPTEEDDDMARIMRSTGKPDALQDGPLFIGLNAEESKNLAASGLKVVWITPGTWDALANGAATGQPFGRNTPQ